MVTTNDGKHTNICAARRGSSLQFNGSSTHYSIRILIMVTLYSPINTLSETSVIVILCFKLTLLRLSQYKPQKFSDLSLRYCIGVIPSTNDYTTYMSSKNICGTPGDVEGHLSSFSVVR